MKLALFDIDGTLMDFPQQHKDSFAVAFRKVYGIDTDISIIQPMGMTEQQIITEVLQKKGVDGQTIKSKMPEAMHVMEEYFDKEMKNVEVNVLPGARELLQELAKNNVLMGAVTGNLEKIARIKLKKAGLNDYIKLGGFGSDHMIRTELVKLATRRAEDQFGFKYSESVYSIGDAPSDMKAGREGGAFKCIGIATGVHSVEQLKEAGADFVFKNLLEKDKILKIILE
ncbi:MAG: HAD family hydrolase [Candidatus Staskawiczbacteria bacterium]|nr:HAD family hydrolase [Candidatus Staskawiczbacteria bacterium]